MECDRVKKFSSEDLRDIVWDCMEGYETIEDNHTGSSRWTEFRECIFLEQSTGKHYRVDYEKGLTEMQECDMFNEKEIEVEEVEKKEKITYEWVKV